LSSIQYKAGFKYQIVEDFTLGGLALPIQSEHNTQFLAMRPSSITLKKGYASDGPSWPAIDTATFMRGAFTHDGMYQAIRMGWLPPEARVYADKLLRQMCLEDGMNPLRAWYIYKGLRFGGGPAADPRNRRVTLVAPTRQS
jgi:hypothetical protein